MKKTILFLKRHRYWITLMLGGWLSIAALMLGIGGISLLEMIYPGGELAAGVILLMLAARFFGRAFDLIDEAHYRRHYEMTGDDFERRYLKERKEEWTYVFDDEL